MTVENIEATGDSSEIFENWNDRYENVSWNGREITTLNQKRADQSISKAQAIIQSLHTEKKIQLFLHHISLIEDVEEQAFDFSPDKLSEVSLENAKKEVEGAWNLFNQLKSSIENDLAALKEIHHEFNPALHARETILNTILQDNQKHEFSKNLISSQSWTDIIKLGHEKIDHAFAALASHDQMLTSPSPPQKSSPTFLEKIRLGLEIIGRGIMEPGLLELNSPLDVFIEKENIDISAEVLNQSIGEFLETITNAFKNDQKSLISPLKVLGPSKDYESIHKIGKIDSSSPQQIKTEAPSTELRSRYFKVEGTHQNGTLITFINGMNNDFEEAKKNAAHLQKLSPVNPSIEGIYNHSNGKVIDSLEIMLLNYKGHSPITQNLLMQKWTEFHEKNKDNPEAKLLHFCHSQGAIHTKNALLRLPKEIRDRILVVAIAPATVISRNLCYDSFNYASKKDIVPCGELLAAYWHACNLGETEREEMLVNAPNIQNELIWLTPHEKATGLDHEFQSPTFKEVINFHIQKYAKGNY